MFIFQQPLIAVTFPVSATAQSNSIAAAPTKPEGEGNDQTILIRGTSTSGDEVAVEMVVTQKQSNYYGRFSRLGKPLQLMLRLTTTERTSAGRTQNTSMETVEELRLDDLIKQAGGVENLENLQLVPAAKGSNRWQFAHQEQPYAAMTVDLNLGRVVYDVGKP